MRKESIEFTIKPDGDVEFVIKGIKGSGCEQVSTTLARSLGSVEQKRKTPEYYERPVDTRIVGRNA